MRRWLLFPIIITLILLGCWLASRAWADNFSYGSGASTPSPTVPLAIQNGTAGTTLNSLAKLDTSGKAVATTTADTDGVIGIVTAGAGNTGTATIYPQGQINCNFDGATTAGDWVAISNTTAGDCTDSGTIRPATGQTIGKVLTTNGSSGLYTVALQLSYFNVGNYSGLISLKGNSTTTPSTITQTSLSGRIDVTDPYYGAIASTATEACVIVAGSKNVTCTGNNGFKVGQAITLNHAGASVSVGQPGGGAATTSATWNAAANATTADGAGSTNASAQLVSTDGLGGSAAPLALSNISNSESSLTFMLFNKEAWTNAVGATATAVYTCVGTSCNPTLVGVVPKDQGFYYDMGSVTGIHFGTDTADGTSPPAGALNDNLNTTVAAVDANGNPTQLTAAALNSAGNNQNNTGATVLMFHDNSVAINAAINALCANGGEIYIPAGVYPIGQSITASNCRSLRIRGASNAQSPYGTTLLWYGGLGGDPFYMNCIADSTFADFSVNDVGGQTPAYGFHIGNHSCSGVSTARDHLENLEVGESGYGYALTDSANNCPHAAYNIGVTSGGIANLMINNAQSKNNTWTNFAEAPRLFGFYQVTSGDQYFYGRQGAGHIDNWLSTVANFADYGGENEVSQRYAVTAGPTGGWGSVAFYSSHLQMATVNLPTDGIIFSDSFNAPLLLTGVNFIGSGNNQTTMGIYTNDTSNNGAIALVSIDNNYSGCNPFQYVSAANTVFSYGDRCNNGGAVNVVMPHPFTEFSSSVSGQAHVDYLWGDSTTHRLMMQNNNGTAINVGGLFASGTTALSTSTINSGGNCNTTTTATTGVLSTDTIVWSHNAAPTAATNGQLTIHPYPTAGNVNFMECNPTAGNITPPADTLNWQVLR